MNIYFHMFSEAGFGRLRVSDGRGMLTSASFNYMIRVIHLGDIQQPETTLYVQFLFCLTCFFLPQQKACTETNWVSIVNYVWTK